MTELRGFCRRGTGRSTGERPSRKDSNLKNVLRFAGVFLMLYLVFSRMWVMMRVQMGGWQFIVFVIVLALIVEYMVEKVGRN